MTATTSESDDVHYLYIHKAHKCTERGWLVGFRHCKLFIRRQCNYLCSPRLGTLPGFPLSHRSRGHPPPVPTTHQHSSLSVAEPRTVSGGLDCRISGRYRGPYATTSTPMRGHRQDQLNPASSAVGYLLSFSPIRPLLFLCSNLAFFGSKGGSTMCLDQGNGKPSSPYQHLMTWSGRAVFVATLQYSTSNAFPGAVSRPVRHQELQSPARPAASILMINMPLTQ